MNTGNSLADRIRAFAMKTVVRTGTHSAKSEIVIRAGDIHSQMGLQSRMPAVCAALSANKFQQLSGLQLARQEGPQVGSNTVFYFRRTGDPDAPESHPPSPEAPAAPKKKTRSTNFQINPEAEIWVSCVSRKQASESLAKDLYISDWFTKARNFVELTGCRWRILSAKYGLVSPDRTISPYELTLNKMGVYDRRRWAETVLEQLRREPELPHQVVMLAGARYREFLEPELVGMGIRVNVPMTGMRIGEQLQWLGEQARCD